MYYYITTTTDNHQIMKPNRHDSASQRKRNEDALFNAVKNLDGLAECRNFFKDLCTPAELQALVDRWQVVGLLQKELPYRRIHDITGVSVTTIGRVARFLSDGFGGYATAIEHGSAHHPSRKKSAAH